jgi:hypothetical protein
MVYSAGRSFAARARRAVSSHMTHLNISIPSAARIGRSLGHNSSGASAHLVKCAWSQAHAGKAALRAVRIGQNGVTKNVTFDSIHYAARVVENRMGANRYQYVIETKSVAAIVP